MARRQRPAPRERDPSPLESICQLEPFTNKEATMSYDPLALLVHDIESARLRRREERLRRDPELIWNLEATSGRRRQWRLPAWLSRLRLGRVADTGSIGPADSALGTPSPPPLWNP
jgi:hypothetical protein